MSDQKDKTPEQVSDEVYKVAPTSADKGRLNKQRAPTDKKEQEQQFPTETNVKEELREGVE